MEILIVKKVRYVALAYWYGKQEYPNYIKADKGEVLHQEAEWAPMTENLTGEKPICDTRHCPTLVRGLLLIEPVRAYQFSPSKMRMSKAQVQLQRIS